jgi:hypothetical protein
MKQANQTFFCQAPTGGETAIYYGAQLEDDHWAVKAYPDQFEPVEDETLTKPARRRKAS